VLTNPTSYDLPAQGSKATLQTADVPKIAVHPVLRRFRGIDLFRRVNVDFQWPSRGRFGVYAPNYDLCDLTTIPLYIDYAANSWRVRWWLLDGWLSLLYFFAFGCIAYLWRPSANNSR